MIAKITAKLKLVFDEATSKEDANGLTITVKHKGKEYSFMYKKGTYDIFNRYEEKDLKAQVRGMAVDCLDKFMEG